MVDISILTMVYEPTYNLGAPPCMEHYGTAAGHCDLRIADDSSIFDAS